MSIADSVRVAVSALTAHLLRSTLAMLGLIIGVGAVITLLAVGRGSQADVTRNILSLGTNLLTIRPVAPQQGTVRVAAGSRPTLSYEDAKALAEPGVVPGISAVTVESNAGVQIIVPGGGNLATRATATDESYPLVRNTPLAAGEFFTADHVRTNATVLVLGSNVANNLFGGVDAVGQTVRVSVGRTGLIFTVVGVMASQGGTALGNLDDRVLLPITTSNRVLQRFRGPAAVNFVDQIDVAATSPAMMEQAMTGIGIVLRERHEVTTDDFLVQSQQDTLAAASGIAQAQSFLLGSIAGISLVVGGIGIMNTMLVSVFERTREIGIRRAVGAHRRDILVQFLVEAVLVCCAGGLLGAAMGIGTAWIVDGRKVIGQTIHAEVHGDAVLLALLVSVGIGIFFGFYPASRAARLRPIEALRYE
ncbi:MAG: ABC transporter permease [Dehalococcoidia bacterium]